MEYYAPYQEGSGITPRDVPPSIRGGPETLQAFWERAAPPRPPSDLAYPSLSWDKFEGCLRRECSGGDAALFRRFDAAKMDTAISELRARLIELGMDPGSGCVDPKSLIRYTLLLLLRMVSWHSFGDSGWMCVRLSQDDFPDDILWVLTGYCALLFP